MKCYVHPEAQPIGTCTRCGRGICEECAVDVQGKLTCRNCLAAGDVTVQQRYDPNTAFLLELVGGFFGLLGIGYIYVGRTNEGITRLVLWLVYDIIAAVAISVLIAVIVGIVCIPFQLVIQIGVPIWSATTLKNELLSHSLE